MNAHDEQELINLRRERAVRRYCSTLTDLVNSDDVAALIRDEVLTTPDGAVNLSSAQEAVSRLQQTRPYLFKSSRQDLGIVTQGIVAPRQLSDEEMAPQLFGRLSSSAKAHALGMTDLPSYHRIKKVAERMGLI